MRKLWKSLALLLCSSIGSYAVNPFENITGEWQQVYSDYFVQSTTEIDWFCVNVTIEETYDEDVLTLTKRAYLHGGDIDMASFPRLITTFDSGLTWIIGAQQFINRYNGSKENVTVLTGIDGLSLFVWTRNKTAFLGSSEEKEVLDDLERWNFTGTYKSPVLVPCNRTE